MNLHTYHHLCSALLLSTPYTLASLPRRAPPAEDGAYILPLPDLDQITSSLAGAREGGVAGEDGQADVVLEGEDATEAGHIHAVPPTPQGLLPHSYKGRGGGDATAAMLPSLLSPNLRAARKLLVVRREDGYEVRRVWRCGRCAGVVGYEIVGQGQGEGGGEVEEGETLSWDGKVLYLVEGGLVETGVWEGLEKG